MRLWKKKIPASVLFKTDKKLSDEAKLLISKCARSTAKDYIEDELAQLRQEMEVLRGRINS